MESCRLIMLVGLPQSGKSTWAVQQNYPIVSPEAVGLTLYGQLFPVSAKPITWAFAKVMVDILFTAGHDTIILEERGGTSGNLRNMQDTIKICILYIVL